MEQRRINFGLGARRSPVVASLSLTMLCVLWLLSGRRPSDGASTLTILKGRPQS